MANKNIKETKKKETPERTSSNDINPRVDIAFQKIFGVEENKDLLISLINSIVQPEDQVTTITIKNPYNPRSFKLDKLSVLDIKAEGPDGKKFNIEMQVTDEANYDKRALYYWAKVYTQQIGKTNKYSQLQKTIGIHFLYFLSIPESSKYHNTFVLKEDETGVKFFKQIELHTIELSKFDNCESTTLTTLAEKIKNKLDLWAAFLTHHDLLVTENLPESLQDPEIRKAVEVIEVMNFTTEERALYESRIDWLRLEADALDKAEDRGRDEGIEKGRIEGKIEGKIEGEHNKAIQIAKKMLSKNKSIEEIIELTELSKAEIENL